MKFKCPTCSFVITKVEPMDIYCINCNAYYSVSETYRRWNTVKEEFSKSVQDSVILVGEGLINRDKRNHEIRALTNCDNETASKMIRDFGFQDLKEFICYKGKFPNSEKELCETKIAMQVNQLGIKLEI